MLSHQINNQNTSKDKKISPLTSYSTIKASPENCEISNLVDKIKNNDSFGEGVNELYGFLIKDPSKFFLFSLKNI